jgi:hexokinase
MLVSCLSLVARTKYDIIIDESSNKPGEQSFEKMIAGLYLGEVFRLIVTDLIDSGDLFLGQNTYKLEKAYAFDTAFLSLMERWARLRIREREFEGLTQPSDTTDELLTVIGVFTHFFGVETTLEERQFFKKLAVLIGTRAARLSACGIAAIVSKKGYLEKGCAVGADGSLYNVSGRAGFLILSLPGSTSIGCSGMLVGCRGADVMPEIPQLCQPRAHRPRRHLWGEGQAHRHAPRRGRVGCR